MNKIQYSIVNKQLHAELQSAYLVQSNIRKVGLVKGCTPNLVSPPSCALVHSPLKDLVPLDWCMHWLEGVPNTFPMCVCNQVAGGNLPHTTGENHRYIEDSSLYLCYCSNWGAVEGTASQCQRRHYRHPGSQPGCITSGCDWESHRAVHNWPSVIRVLPV